MLLLLCALQTLPNALLVILMQAGETALMKASAYGYVEVVDTLIQAGMVVNLKKSNGQTALAVAALDRHAAQDC